MVFIVTILLYNLYYVFHVNMLMLVSLFVLLQKLYALWKSACPNSTPDPWKLKPFIYETGSLLSLPQPCCTCSDILELSGVSVFII